MALIPLKIPMGFAVCHNEFHDIEPSPSKEGDEFIENWGYFTEDILQIVKMELKEGSWYIPLINNYVIDLGWYPDGKITGQYKLVLAKVNEDCSWNILKEKTTSDRFEIRDVIEEWMQSLLQKGF